MIFSGKGIPEESGKPMWLENAYSMFWCPFLFGKESRGHVGIKAKGEDPLGW